MIHLAEEEEVVIATIMIAMIAVIHLI